MNTEQQEALDAVDRINDELFEIYDKRNEQDKYKDWITAMPILSLTIAGGYTFITLNVQMEADGLEIHLYNSENNDLIYYEDSDSYEPLYDYIKRKFIEIKEEVYSIEL